MALSKLRSAEDWEPYLDETRRLYLEDNLTVPRLVEHFKSQYGLDVRCVTSLLTHSSPTGLFTNPYLARTSSRSSSTAKDGPGPRTYHFPENNGLLSALSSANASDRARRRPSTLTIDLQTLTRSADRLAGIKPTFINLVIAQAPVGSGPGCHYLTWRH